MGFKAALTKSLNKYAQQFIDKNKLTWVALLPRFNNLGYAGGNNEGLEYIHEKDLDFDYIWFLNPDTKLRPNALQNLIREAEANHYPIVGSRLEDEDGTFFFIAKEY